MTQESPSWTFLTNHAIVLLCIVSDPTLTLRQIGDRVGITERATHRIVSELADAGYLTVAKNGRRNAYTVRHDLPLRHPEARHAQVGELFRFLCPAPTRRAG